jgi:hypothetical protein
MDLDLGGRIVPVSDTFKQLSRAEQEEVIERIIADKGIAPEPSTLDDIGTGIKSAIVTGAAAIPASIPALAYDLAVAPGHLLYKGIDAAAGLAGYDTGLAKRHAELGGGPMGMSARNAELATQAADALVEAPKTPAGKIVRAVGSAGIESLGGSGIFKVAGRLFTSLPEAQAFLASMAEGPKTQAAYSAAAGGGGEIAEQQGAPPIVGALLGTAAAVGAHAAVPAVKTGARVVKDAPADYLLRDEAAKERAVVKQLRKGADDPKALDEWARSGETGELVPGSKPTLFEAAGEDLGIGRAERTAAMKGTGGFDVEIERRRAEQNKAQVDELRRIAGEGTPEEILAEFRRQRDRIDAETAGRERTAQTEAEAATRQAVTTQTPEAVGEGIRRPVVAQQAAATARGNELYANIGAQGVTVGTGRLKAAIARAWQDIAENPLSKEERRIANLVKGYGPRLDFTLLDELRKNVLGRASDMNLTPTERGRAKLLVEAIEEATDSGLQRAIKDDPNLFRKVADGMEAGGLPAKEGAPLGMRGRRGAERPKPTMPLSEFIARHGGLPLDAESTARDWGNVRVKGRPLAHTGGRSIDNYWRETLIEEGYLPPDYHEATGVGVARDVDDEVRRLLEDELHGGRRVDTSEAAGRALDGPEKEFADARAMVADRVRREGVENPSPSSLDEAARMLVEGEETHPFTAYERAETAQGQDLPAPQRLYHGSREANIPEIRRSERGPLGQAAYLTPNRGTAEIYAGEKGVVHEADVAEDIFQGMRSRDSSVNPYAVWREQSERLLGAVEPEHRAALGEMLEKLHYDDGYPLYRRIVNLYKDEGAAQDLFRRAGYKGISANVDGPEVAMFDPVKTRPNVPFEGGGVPESPVDEAITQRQREARRHWKENVKQPYELEPVAGVVERAPLSASGFEMTPGGVAETAFQSGNKGAEGIRALRAAGATDTALAEAAALSFSDPRRGVVRDGVVDPNGFRRWVNNYGPAIRELPLEVQRRFLSANTAAEYVAQVMVHRAESLNRFDQRAVGKLLGVPAENLPNAIRSRLENPAAINDLMDGVANNPQARAGLQRLVADHITQRFTNASEMISKNALTNFVKDHRTQLTAIFGEEGAERFRRIAADIERSRRQMTVGKDPAGPGTAGDLWKGMVGETSVMTLVKSLGGAPGVAAYGVAKHLAGYLRLAGIKGRDELYARALLDPELARKLLTRAPALKNRKFVNGLGSTILRSSVAGMAYGGNQ